MKRWLFLWAMFATGGAVLGIGQGHLTWLMALGITVQAVTFALAVGMPPVPGSDFE